MLKRSVQIELFLILWETKLIYSESSMYTVLDKYTIKYFIISHDSFLFKNGCAINVPLYNALLN
jgi:hypothetical protein